MSKEPERTKLGPHVEGWGQFCSRVPTPDLDIKKACGVPMQYHIAITADDEPSGVAFLGVCEEHYLLDWRESRRGPDFLDVHEAGLFCGLPGAMYWWSWERPPGECELSTTLDVCTCGQATQERPVEVVL